MDYNSIAAPHLAVENLFATLPPKHSQKFKEQVLAAYQDRMSLRGIHRTFGVCYASVLRWLGEKTEQLPAFKDTLLPAAKGDVLELRRALELRAEQGADALAVGGPLSENPPDRGLDLGRPQPAKRQ